MSFFNGVQVVSYGDQMVAVYVAQGAKRAVVIHGALGYLVYYTVKLRQRAYRQLSPARLKVYVAL